MLQAASIRVSITLFATFATIPRMPSSLGLGSGLHLSLGSSILTNITPVSSSSVSFCFTLRVGTTPSTRLGISGMNKSRAVKILSSQVGVGLAQFGNSGHKRAPGIGVIVGVWKKKDVGSSGPSTGVAPRV